jgi:hypothetical protein
MFFAKDCFFSPSRSECSWHDRIRYTNTKIISKIINIKYSIHFVSKNSQVVPAIFLSPSTLVDYDGVLHLAVTEQAKPGNKLMLSLYEICYICTKK